MELKDLKENQSEETVFIFKNPAIRKLVLDVAKRVLLFFAGRKRSEGREKK